ncbi:MAG: DUF3467 domain-containing protein [Candidatus Scalindua sp.]
MVKKKTKAKTKTKASKEDEFVTIPLKFHIPDTIITHFVTNTTVQIMEQEFKISFFEMKPELCLDPTAKLPSKVQADCVASVVMTPERISRLISTLQAQLDKYNSRQGETKK